MERLTKRLLVVFGLCLLIAGSAWADVQTLYVNGLPHNTYGGYYVGPAGASLSATGRSDFDIVCDDFPHTTYVPSSFTVAITNLTNAAGSITRFGNQPGALLEYQQAAWLITQMEANPGQVGPIQFAIWNLFYSAAPDKYISSGIDWYKAATDRPLNADGVDYSQFEILTPFNTNGTVSPYNQEFIKRVPEPGMLATLLFGLLGVGLFWRRRSCRAV